MHYFSTKLHKQRISDEIVEIFKGRLYKLIL